MKRQWIKNEKVMVVCLVLAIIKICLLLVEQHLVVRPSHYSKLRCESRNLLSEELKASVISSNNNTQSVATHSYKELTNSSSSSNNNSESVDSHSYKSINVTKSISSNNNSESVSVDTHSYASINMTKFFFEYLDSEDKRSDTNKPYRLGPKVSNWDEKRANWLKNNPEFPNFIRPNKPRVLLVTGSSSKPCENRVGDHYLLKSIKNKIDDCRIHGIEIYYNTALLDAELEGWWGKYPLIRTLMLSHPEIELFWWMDSDAMFTDMAFELPWERYKDSNLVVHGWDKLVYEEKNWCGLNAGIFLLRNTQWSLDFIDEWTRMGPKGKVRDEGGKLLARELKNRLVFEADDQSSLVYLLATQRKKWGDKVYLESSYVLHGFWRYIVDRYEEIITNHHPGLGDDRWPLVTHFVGCKPCAESGMYDAEGCLKGMDRAYYFADNQILQMYGFGHKSLANSKVVRIRNETSDPLEVKDETGLLHPSFNNVS